jgi:DNA-binding transcriptional ArsR family regulator
MASAYHTINLMLKALLRKVDTLDMKISAIKEELKAPRGPAAGNAVYLTVGIQTTIKALKTLKTPITAQDLATITGRARAVESTYLNELFRNGMVARAKRGRERLFMLKEEYRDKG